MKNLTVAQALKRRVLLKKREDKAALNLLYGQGKFDRLPASFEPCQLLVSGMLSRCNVWRDQYDLFVQEFRGRKVSSVPGLEKLLIKAEDDKNNLNELVRRARRCVEAFG
jgi:hypothetical protein